MSDQKQKHYTDIQNLREFDVDLGNDVIRRNNREAFQPGNHIVIQEKIDGANASFCYNPETGKLDAFSRKNPLNEMNTLRGFWNIVQDLNAEDYKDYPNFVFFGEMLVPHTIKYNKEAYNQFYLFDIYDKEEQCYILQNRVKELAGKLGLNYIHTLYDGPFISWDHCKTFLNSPAYGDAQEGICVKSQELSVIKKGDRDSRNPSYLKIVNEKFKETMKSKEPKEEDPEVIAAKANAQRLMSSIVTKARVEKLIFKLVDEGLIPNDLKPENMKDVARNLPKRLYDDCVKEEPEIVSAAGQYSGKLCSSIGMQIARDVILGN